MSLSQANPSSFGGLLESRSIINSVDAEIAILLITQLGPDGPQDANSRAILMDGLRSSLSHEGRETTLPLADWNSGEPSDLTRHILRIGKALFQYASEANHIVPVDPSLTVYSPCEGHKWVPPAGRLLRSQLSRGAFLEVAKTLTAPGLTAGGYGFQSDRGVVLPAAVFSGTASRLLLRYSPARLIPEHSQQPVLFVSGSALEAAATVEISDLGLSSAPTEFPRNTSITFEKTQDSDGEQVQYSLKLTATPDQDKPDLSVDIGHVVHGVDDVTGASEEEEEAVTANNMSRIYEASSVLLAGPHVMQNSSANPAIIRDTEEVDLLALLGKLDARAVRLSGRWKRGDRKPLSLHGSRAESPQFLIMS
ncbi:uncharacterized protein B0H64DRAFT_462823 [Chaetomium fimeti]|uniref:Uncharacterized protein n=1 Tax=Chaetomium fimeti TaxID=1854472 RepID=A0AAE0LQW6_9PEZI|nr:hypothetical protein B0H64DRAFT_462823 [Chaetomium fimeti]